MEWIWFSIVSEMIGAGKSFAYRDVIDKVLFSERNFIMAQ